MAAEYEHGITDTHLADNQWEPGTMAWLLDVVTDWEAFAERLRTEHVTPEALVRKALDAYLAAA